MKRLIPRIVVAVSTVALAIPAAQAQEGALVYLLPDATDRYRPAVATATGASVLADINSITPPGLSPDGTRVAFSGSLGDESLGLYALFVVNLDGSGLTQVTEGNYGEMDPEWSPDGDRIAISQNVSGDFMSNTCCRLATVDVDSGSVTVLTTAIGATRPSYSPDGSLIVFDTPSGIWKIPSDGGTAVKIATVGYDATVSPDGQSVAYLVDGSGVTQLRTVPIDSGGSEIVYSTSGSLEAPHRNGSRISFFEFTGSGYDGRSNVRLRSVSSDSAAPQTDRNLSSHQVGMSLGSGNDELFFYRNNGLFAFYDIDSAASLGSPIQSGSGYSSGWSSISSIDLDADGSDEMLFYRATDGTFKYYDMHGNGNLGSLIRSGIGYSIGWRSITSIDLDGDAQDEVFFYREDGTFRFYEIGPTASLGAPIQSGSGYSNGWTSITALDLDGDGSDEMLFYRATDGTFKYYDVHPDGQLGSLIRSGTGYSTGWSSISGVDLDGDGQDEIFFYRQDGTFRYYNIDPTASLGGLVDSGSGYDTGWTWITSVDIDG